MKSPPKGPPVLPPLPPGAVARPKVLKRVEPKPPPRVTVTRAPPRPPPVSAPVTWVELRVIPSLVPPARADGYQLSLGPVRVEPFEQGVRFRAPVAQRECLRDCASAFARASGGQVQDAAGLVFESHVEAQPLAGIELQALWLEAVARERARGQARDRRREKVDEGSL